MDTSQAVLVNNHRQDGWLAVAIVMAVVETTFFALRIYCRWSAKVSWGADDYLTGLGYIASMALNAVGIAITTRTWVGQHTDDVVAVDPDSVVLFLKLTIPLALTYICAAILPKMAIVALFLRIFIQKPFRIACWIIQTVLVLYLIAGIASILSTCRPFSANWKIPGTLSEDEHCFDITSQYKAGSYPNIVTDLAIIIVPIPVVWKMHKSTSEKLGVLGTFCLGLVGLAFSIARLVAFFDVFSAADILYTAAYTGIFTTLEPSSYFLVACMMTFRRLLRLLPCGGRKSTYGSSSRGGPESHGSSTYGSGSRGSARRWPSRPFARFSGTRETVMIERPQNPKPGPRLGSGVHVEAVDILYREDEDWEAEPRRWSHQAF